MNTETQKEIRQKIAAEATDMLAFVLKRDCNPETMNAWVLGTLSTLVALKYAAERDDMIDFGGVCLKWNLSKQRPIPVDPEGSNAA